MIITTIRYMLRFGFLAVFALLGPAAALAQEGDPALLSQMRQINAELRAAGFEIAMEQIDFFTIGEGRPSNRLHAQEFRCSVVDIFAPGSSILSAWRTSDTATATLSGTSMATPHVAGVVARFLQANPGASPATARNELVNQATLNRLSGIPSGTANRLLFWASSR